MVDTVRSRTALLALLADNSSGDISPQDIRDMLVSLDTTGWGSYTDTQYTNLSPFAVSANTDTTLPNNAATKIETQKPSDIVTFYNGTHITGREGDGVLVTVDFVAVPTSPSATSIDTWLDIGGSIGEIFRRTTEFPKGNGVAHNISYSLSAYMLGTWEDNGALFRIRCNGPCNVYNIRYVITRTHRARS